MSQTWNDAVPARTREALADLDAIRAKFDALKSSFSGGSAPANPVAGMFWFDTTADILKLRNEANTAWLNVYDFANQRTPLALNCSRTVVGGTGISVSGSLNGGNATVGISSSGVGNAQVANGAIGAEKFQTGTDERTWVLARAAGASVGAVGTYAMLATSTTRNVGETASGGLFYAGMSGRIGQNLQILVDTITAVPGTWRCMGTCYSAGGGYAVSLWLRIS